MRTPSTCDLGAGGVRTDQESREGGPLQGNGCVLVSVVGVQLPMKKFNPDGKMLE